MPTDWPTATLAAIRRECRRGQSPRFSRKDLIANELSRISQDTQTNGATPAQTLSRVLQTLRDSGHIEFLGDGDYRYLKELRVEVAGSRLDRTPPARQASSEEHQEKKPSDVGFAFDLSAPDTTERSTVVVRRIIRDSPMVARLKRRYGFRCQLCGMTIEVPGHNGYCEGHHIRPLGDPHNGPDVEANIIIVCPNHHAMLDYGTIPLQGNEFMLSLHSIDSGCVDYHNNNLHRKGSQKDADHVP